MLVLDRVNQNIYWLENNKVVKTLHLPNSQKIGRITYDSATGSLYGDDSHTELPTTILYEINQETGVINEFTKIDYRCYSYKVYSGRLYFVINMNQIDSEFNTTGLFMSKKQGISKEESE